MEPRTFWMMAHWLARKHKLSIAQTLRPFKLDGGLGPEELRLLRHSSFPALSYRERFFKPNPYTTQERIEREELPETDPWRGYEERPGMADLRPRVIRRDGFQCQRCRTPVTTDTCEVDHLRPVRDFKRPVDANVEDNLGTLCIPCHRSKTERDRQRESRMR
jgi:5-methylcytosine-specific restriction endonuclease McrA